MLELASIHVHPVKSLGGIAVDAAEVRERGLLHDRAWVVVGPDGEALTQRTHPRMALVATGVEDGRLRLAAADREPIHVPGGTAARTAAIVWGDEVDGADCGDDAAEWLSGFLGTECRLVHMDERARRVTHPDGGAGREVRFADELPLLVLSEATVADVDARAPLPVEIERFRPNLVVRGCEPYAEDAWRRLRVGGVEIEMVKPASRCVLVTVDPATGEREPRGEPLRTLAGYRSTSGADYRHKPNRIYLGVRAAATTTGVVRVGDAVEVLDGPT